MITLSISLLIILSCGDDEDNIAHNVTASAYFRGMMIDGKAKYAPVLVAESSDEPVTLTASDNKDKKYTLTTYWGHKLRYRWVPDTAAYKETVENLTFNLLATYKDRKDVKEATSASLDGVPKSFSITDSNYDDATNKFEVHWTNASANYYMISIAKDIDEKPAFQSLSLKIDNPKDTLKFTFDKSTLKWYDTPPVSGEYLLMVHAFNLSGSKVQGEFVSGKRLTFGK